MAAAYDDIDMTSAPADDDWVALVGHRRRATASETRPRGGGSVPGGRRRRT